MSAVLVTKDRVKKIVEATRRLTTTDVMVGIPSTATARSDGPLNNAEIGYIHEFGAPAANIPARPFLRPAVDSMRDRIAAYMRSGALAALNGDKGGVTYALTALGLTAQNVVRAKIQSGPFVPLKPSTLAKRRAAGRTGTRPLIDTGQLRNSINYVLRRKG